MKARQILLAVSVALVGLLGAGCTEPVPVNPVPTDGSNPHVSGTPQERIQRIQADTLLTPEEKAFRIKVIKERNHIQ